MLLESHTLVLTLLIISLTLKSSRIRWAIFPVIAILTYPFFLQNPVNDTGQAPNIRNPFLTYLFVASDYILLTDIQREFRMKDQQEPIINAPFWARLCWALALLFSPRGVGWSHEPIGILPPYPRLSRARFIVSQLFWSTIYLILIDVIHLIVVQTLVFAPESVPTASMAWHWRFLGVFLIGLGATTYLNLSHAILSIVCVTVHISEPKGWPQLFGKWSDAYTIRRFWGRTWHQLLRRILSSHGKYLTRRLQLPAGRNSSSYVQLYTAFFISGIIHTPHPDARPLYFFMYQALAITFEDKVIALANNLGYNTPNYMQKLIGYMWVFCWFTYSISDWTDSLISWGMVNPFSVGIISPLLGYTGLILH